MFLKIGHRGAKAYEIENTIESFEKAIRLGANAVELDVRKSKDGKLVVSYDDNLKCSQEESKSDRLDNQQKT
jgi:glycerophosphoryl diester phosphodiesterase